MANPDDFGVQLGTVYGLEANIMHAALRIADATDNNLAIKSKMGLAGPNDIIYLINNIDVWRELLPWAVKSAGTGALGAVGAALYNRYFNNKTNKKLAEISDKQSQLGEYIDRLIDEIKSTDRYWEQYSEVRFSLPTAVGFQRDDVGFIIRDPERDPQIAVMAINAIGDDIIDNVARLNAGQNLSKDSSHFSRGVTGEIEVLADGTVRANVKAREESVSIIATEKNRAE